MLKVRNALILDVVTNIKKSQNFSLRSSFSAQERLMPLANKILFSSNKEAPAVVKQN